MDKRASYFTQELLGIETYSQSPDCGPDSSYGTGLVLGPAPAGSISWAIYQFAVGPDTPRDVGFGWSWPSGEDKGIYLAAANFVTGHWELQGPHIVSDHQPYFLVTPEHISPQGNVFAALIVAGDATYRVTSARLGYDAENERPMAFLTATPAKPIMGVDSEVVLDPSASTDSDGNIVRYQWNLDGEPGFEIESPTPDPQVFTLGTEYAEYYVALRVVDDKGTSSSFGIEFELRQDQPPIAECVVTPRSGDPGDPVTLDASLSRDQWGELAKFEWDLDNDGVFELDTGLTATVATNFPAPAGRQLVGVRVTDNTGNSAESYLAISSTLRIFYDQQFNAMSLSVIDGHPAIAYGAVGVDEVRFARALDPAGNNWPAPITVASDVFLYTLALQSIAGKAGLVFAANSETGDGSLYYIASTDATGSTWEAPVLIESMEPYNYYYPDKIDLEEIKGAPALLSPDGPVEHLNYVRAADPAGQSWSAPVSVGFWAAQYDLTEVAGAPAIAYSWQHYDWGGPGQTRYQRAVDADGAVWADPVVVYPSNAALGSLIMIGGLPALSLSQDDGSAHVYQAVDAEGSSWNSLFDIPVDGASTQLLHVGGNPALVSHTQAGLSAYFATGPDGQTWGGYEFIDKPDQGPVGGVGLTTGELGFAFVSQWQLCFDRFQP